MREDGRQSYGLQLSRLLHSYFIDSLVHVHGDVDSVKDIDGLASLFNDHREVRLPHFTTEEQKLSCPSFSKRVEKTQ